MANLPISGLVASAANLAGTDVVPVVQTTGVGPVKMTGLQLAGGLLGSAALTGATVTTSQPVLDLSQTWNAGAVTFTGLKFNATDTASATGSLLLDLQVGGTSRFSVSKAGAIIVPAGSYSGVNFGVAANEGWNIISNGAYYFRAGVSTVGISTSSFMLGSNARLEWSLGSPGANGADLILVRDAANTLALRNGTNAQTFSVYNTFTDASNYTLGRLVWAGGNFYLQCLNAGTGAAAGIVIQPGSGQNTTIGTGNFVFGTDGGGDIGATSSGRPNNVFVKSYMQMTEMTAPSAPATNNVRIYAEDNGSGKTRLMALFPTGAAVQIAIEP